MLYFPLGYMNPSTFYLSNIFSVAKSVIIRLRLRFRPFLNPNHIGVKYSLVSGGGGHAEQCLALTIDQTLFLRILNWNFRFCLDYLGICVLLK